MAGSLGSVALVMLLGLIAMGWPGAPALADAPPTDSQVSASFIGPGLPGLFPLPAKVRAFWVVRYDLAGSPDASRDASRIAHEAARAGANTLFVQVSGRGDAWYNSDLLPRAVGLDEAAEDPFGLLIAAAHELELSVHAWVNVGLVWSRPRRPSAAGHVVNLHPEWLMVLPDGTSMIDVPSDSLRDWRVEGTFAELSWPGYRHHIGEVVREIATRYPVDGIHLDYIRRPNLDTGYDPTTLAQFEGETGISADVLLDEVNGFAVTDDRWSWPDYSGDQPTAAYSRWNRFRRDSVTRTVERVRQVVNEVAVERGNPLLLSAAVIPEPVRARDRYAQEWTDWLAAGLLDFAVPMCYQPGRKGAETALQAVLAEADAAKVVVGVACYNQPIADAADAVARVLQYPVRGASIFSFGSLEAEGFAGFPALRHAWLGDAPTAAGDLPEDLGRGGKP